MHSHDRTMWASLAGGDKDKTNTLHGLACRYLTEPEQALRLLSVCNPTAEGWTNDLCKRENNYDSKILEYEWVTFQDPVVRFLNRSLEHPINKGQGQYMTTVGFLDAVANYTWEWTVITRGEKRAVAYGPIQQFGFQESQLTTDPLRQHVRSGYAPTAMYPCGPTVLPNETHGRLRVLVEVKIHPVDADEVLRQIRLYQQYMGETRNQFIQGCGRYLDQNNIGNQFWVLAVRFDTSAAYRSALEEHGIKVVQLGAKFDEWVAALKNSGGSAADEV